ncbi:hypothetical protein NDU88_007862 [Pleurodeles waltl]|uniref:Uncharacterized protein n=1 Tax=Pleurodeles waltl TaxID=8319 RepID=A0AAV7VTJ7_PLEWA|nr:hypothetical protein NDU88_007862 [Pleurodeles waltl]
MAPLTLCREPARPAGPLPSAGVPRSSHGHWAHLFREWQALPPLSSQSRPAGPSRSCQALQGPPPRRGPSSLPSHLLSHHSSYLGAHQSPGSVGDSGDPASPPVPPMPHRATPGATRLAPGRGWCSRAPPLLSVGPGPVPPRLGSCCRASPVSRSYHRRHWAWDQPTNPPVAPLGPQTRADSPRRPRAPQAPLAARTGKLQRPVLLSPGCSVRPLDLRPLNTRGRSRRWGPGPLCRCLGPGSGAHENTSAHAAILATPRDSPF